MVAQVSTESPLTLISGDAPRVRDVLRLSALQRDLWRHRYLIIELTKAELAARYRASLLGGLWAFINPLLLLAVYTFVFGGILRARWPGVSDQGSGEFSRVLFSGLVVFSFMSECLSRSPVAITAVPNYVKKVVFPLQVLPVTIVASALCQLCIGVVVLLAAGLILDGMIHPTIVLLPVVLLPMLFIGLATSWVIAGVGVFIRDVGLAMGFLVQLLIFLTPIFYPLDAVPEPWRGLLQLNPLATVVLQVRQVMLWGELPDFLVLCSWLAVSAGLALLAYAWFMWAKRGFADAL